MIRPHVVLAALPLLTLNLQDDDERLRRRKLDALQDWVGKWRVSMEIVSGPPEIAGHKLDGELVVKWDLGDTALRFDGWAGSEGTSSRKVIVTGLFTYDTARSYSERRYTGAFSWNQDGRLARVEGDFEKNQLRLDLRVDRQSSGFEVVCTGRTTRTVLVRILSGKADPKGDFIRFTLSRL